ncbi:tripartite tricarboxylate transporter TctB family protein [bacterium]|nr:MAG: tripartite tricarboxylate transporter TctB family protein [bacterium]
MRKRVLIEGILLLVISFVGLVEAIHLVSDRDTYTLYDVMGPGYYILFLSLALMVTGTFHIVVNYRKDITEAKVAVDMGLRKRMLGMILVLALYALVIQFFGYLISTILFFLLEFRIAGTKSWRTNIIITVIITSIYYLVFIKYFQMGFPRGIFSINF